MNKLTAEFFGTAVLVLFGCGSVALGGEAIGTVGVALTFGLVLLALVYTIGPISGCHVNPAVSLAVFIAGKMTLPNMVQYWIAQFAGALVGAIILWAIVGSTAGGLGTNGWGEGYGGGFPLQSALIFEIIFTMVFTAVILGSTGDRAAPHFAGIAIGVALVAIHLVGLKVTGVSVNPARSFGPAVLVGGTPLAQLWLFFVGPAIGAVLGGALFRFNIIKG